MATKKGTNKNDRLNGTASDDVIYGLGGNDTIDTRGGRDEVHAGDGNDVIIGYLNDFSVFDGGKGIDTVDYSRMAVSGIGISLTLFETGRGYASFNGKVDGFRSIENVRGSEDNDALTSYTGGLVAGGPGSDIISSYGGIARGDDGADTLYGAQSSASQESFYLQRETYGDKIYYYTSDQDTFLLDAKEFRGLGTLISADELVIDTLSPTATLARAQILFEQQSYKLWYDPDGTGSAPPEFLAQLFSSNTPRHTDFDIV